MLLSKSRVSSLEDIPWFFVFTEGIGFESDNWSVQCEILQANMLGAAPRDEGFPPDDDDFDPHAFHFHGFGQMGQGPPPSPPMDNNHEANLEILEGLGWNAWPGDQANQDNAQDEEIPNLIPINPASKIMLQRFSKQQLKKLFKQSTMLMNHQCHPSRSMS